MGFNYAQATGMQNTSRVRPMVQSHPQPPPAANTMGGTVTIGNGQVPQMSHAGLGPSPGGGQLNIQGNPDRPSRVSGGMQQVSPMAGQGFSAYNRSQQMGQGPGIGSQYFQHNAGPDNGGVVAGLTMPNAVQPQQGPAFDPNDPRNAALAGYQNG